MIRLSRNFGEHAALLAGLSACSGDCAVTKQADLQEDSRIILEMYDSWKRGNKRVLAASRVRQIYSPRIPSISRIIPEEQRITHIKEAQPSIGVPLRYSSPICITR